MIYETPQNMLNTLRNRGKSSVNCKEKIDLRLGVFFDGTANNATNTYLGRLCGAHSQRPSASLASHCKPYMGEPNSSYGNDLTNVYKLYALYPVGITGQLAHQKIYMEGIGTTAGQEDNIVGASIGRGDTGVARRVKAALNDTIKTLNDFHKENPQYVISTITFDIFGFSRGAAAARHFANEIKGSKNDLLRNVLDGLHAYPGTALIDTPEIRVEFIGLFDTVSAIGGSQNKFNIRSAESPGINLHLPLEHFPNVVHLVARDEFRANFPLNSVAPDHFEITVPGAHSDIGGGYLDGAEECVLVSPMQSMDVAEGTDVTETAIYAQAKQIKSQWHALGWPDNLLEIVTPEPRVLAVTPRDDSPCRTIRVYVGVQVKRKVNAGLSQVYLRLMHNLAKHHGVAFNDIYSDDLPSELQQLCERFLSGDYSVCEAEENLLQLDYIHLSANWNSPVGNQTQLSEANLQYLNAPTYDGVRVQHAHSAN